MGVDLALDEFQARMRRKLKAAGHATMAVAHMSLMRRNTLTMIADKQGHSTDGSEAAQAVAMMTAAPKAAETAESGTRAAKVVLARTAPLSQGGAPVAARVLQSPPRRHYT